MYDPDLGNKLTRDGNERLLVEVGVDSASLSG